MPDRAHPLRTQTSRNSWKHLLCLDILTLSGLVSDLMHISIQVNQKIPDGLFYITWSQDQHNPGDPIRADMYLVLVKLNAPVGIDLLGGGFSLVVHTGDEGEFILHKKYSQISVPVVGRFLSVAGVRMGSNFSMVTG
jgi:hypothetical protein